MKKMIFMAAMTAVLASCSTSGKMASLDSMSGEWTIEKIDGATLDNKGETTPFIGFDAKTNKVFGSTSCNRLTGEMTADDAMYYGTGELPTIGFLQSALGLIWRALLLWLVMLFLLTMAL